MEMNEEKKCKKKKNENHLVTSQVVGLAALYFCV